MMSYEMKISFAASISWCVRKEMFAAINIPEKIHTDSMYKIE